MSNADDSFAALLNSSHKIPPLFLEGFADIKCPPNTIANFSKCVMPQISSKTEKMRSNTLS
jgi:hypothetical protein